MTSTQVLLFAVSAVCCIVANVFWYRAKFLLRERGFSVSFYNKHWRDFDHLAELIDSEHDPVQRARFQRLRSRISGFLIASLVFFVIFFASVLAQAYSR